VRRYLRRAIAYDMAEDDMTAAGVEVERQN
jgi:hypothetical protein